MKILAVETSTDACSAALSIDGETRQRLEIAPRRHGELIIPMIDELMNEAGIQVHDLDSLAYGCGPGSFIGLRIASGVTQGIAFAADLPVVPVSSLAAIAQRCTGSGLDQGKQQPVLVVMDARMNEVYWARYRYSEALGIVQLDGTENVDKPQLLPALNDQEWIGAGNGWQVYGDVLKNRTGVTTAVEGILPDAASVAVIALQLAKNGASFVKAKEAQPVYVRDKVANKPA